MVVNAIIIYRLGLAAKKYYKLLVNFLKLINGGDHSRDHLTHYDPIPTILLDRHKCYGGHNISEDLPLPFLVQKFNEDLKEALFG